MAGRTGWTTEAEVPRIAHGQRARVLVLAVGLAVTGAVCLAVGFGVVEAEMRPAGAGLVVAVGALCVNVLVHGAAH